MWKTIGSFVSGVCSVSISSVSVPTHNPSTGIPMLDNTGLDATGIPFGMTMDDIAPSFDFDCGGGGFDAEF